MALSLGNAAAFASLAYGVAATTWGFMMASPPTPTDVVEPVAVYVEAPRDKETHVGRSNCLNNTLLNSIGVDGVTLSESQAIEIETATAAEASIEPTINATIPSEEYAYVTETTGHGRSMPHERETVTTSNTKSDWRGINEYLITALVMSFIGIVLSYGKLARIEKALQQAADMKADLGKDHMLKNCGKQDEEIQEPVTTDTTPIGLKPIMRQLEELRNNQAEQDKKIEALEQANKAKDAKIADQERRLNKRFEKENTGEPTPEPVDLASQEVSKDEMIQDIITQIRDMVQNDPKSIITAPSTGALKDLLRPLDSRVDGISKRLEEQLKKFWLMVWENKSSNLQHLAKVNAQVDSMDEDIALKVSDFMTVKDQSTGTANDILRFLIRLRAVEDVLIDRGLLPPRIPPPPAPAPTPQPQYAPFPTPSSEPSYGNHAHQYDMNPDDNVPDRDYYNDESATLASDGEDQSPVPAAPHNEFQDLGSPHLYDQNPQTDFEQPVHQSIPAWHFGGPQEKEFTFTSGNTFTFQPAEATAPQTGDDEEHVAKPASKSPFDFSVPASFKFNAEAVPQQSSQPVNSDLFSFLTRSDADDTKEHE
ncbi:uncharacterized protein K460DRAFT_436988 [Cucurbitaria berberidis CBS 394.84]|uniref:Uncharacterized protein n=1 Tax=Cucurbitaria berberidis CBS 394.84 TaxID=1168544 RepID=A0A9P4L3S2_9PLEO|nr:uncharacterized protein K460DRAFT_436988 [Cucurbitaria berberidis CBS 394.84]KAF1841251.1 hypothetical protein K460DRAFT_436988 [Cucurbitaria berberidis CBS 394.84]